MSHGRYLFLLLVCVDWLKLQRIKNGKVGLVKIAKNDQVAGIIFGSLRIYFHIYCRRFQWLGGKSGGSVSSNICIL